MNRTRPAIPILLALCAAQAWGQAAPTTPHIGYVYPAGGKRGTTFLATVGGQFLQGADAVHISGKGVQGTVIRHYPPLRVLEEAQREALTQTLRDLIARRWSELAERGAVEGTPPWDRLTGLGPNRRRAGSGTAKKDDELTELPPHPLLYDIERKSLRELLHVVHVFRSRRQEQQQNVQIAESVLVELTVDRDAEPGEREIRLHTRLGLTNPMLFEVDAVREVRELESLDVRVMELLPPEPPLELPVIINGQIMPGDVDRFRFRAKQGQTIVIEARARQLIPYLADAVPGWFQATLTLYDAAGNELAFADDYRFSPDPVMMYEVPEDGEYELEIRDAIYRGRDDFVYRVSIGKRPFITSIFPLGCRAGQKRYVTIDGWNLATNRLFLDGQADPTVGIRQKPLGQGKFSSNPVTYEVNALAACAEIECNDSLETAQPVRLPTIVDGRIGQPGDVDVFQFQGKAGDEVVVEVIARRLCSPLDSLARLIDAGGNVLAWNDDWEHKDGHLRTDMGVLTHHADSYLRATLPESGTYYVQVSDAQGQGGEDCTYRVRIGPPQPDFELRVSPSSVNVRAGLAAPLHVYALRKDGFDGEITFVLKDAPEGFSLAGARIPAGKEHIRLTISAPPRLDAPVALTLEGRARIGGKDVARQAVPAEDMMQAFLYRHLTPSQALMATAVGGRRLARPLRVAQDKPVRISAGGTAQVHVLAAADPRLREVELTLSEPPAGITLREVKPSANGLVLELAADEIAAQAGLQDNLIVEVFMQVERGARQGRGAAQKQRVFVGVLPAIPIEIVSK